jgi:hypothetical protein
VEDLIMSRSLLCGALALTFAVSACTTFQSSERAPAAAASTFVDPRYPEFQQLLASSVDFRARALKFAQSKGIDKGENPKLNRGEGDKLRAAGIQYLQVRKELLEIAEQDGTYFGTDKKVQLTPGKGTKMTTIIKPYVGASRGIPDKKINVWNIDPLDKAGQEAIFRIQMSLASALILMDNYVVGIAPYVKNTDASLILNYDVEQKRQLVAIADSYTNPEHRVQIAAGIELVDAAMKFRREKMIDTNDQESYLYGITQSSIWYVLVKNGETGSALVDRIGNLWDRLTLRGMRGSRILSYGVSMGFGNMVGLYEERKGLLFNMPQAEREGIIREMKPLDILFEKTPFRLTDKFIPGHFGHVAIWLGSEDQLKDLRVWDQLPKEVQARVRAGHYIVEALRPGVQLNSLDHFLNIDDFMVIRDSRSNITDDYRRQAILTSVAQLGKEYDFNFDVNSATRIVCSEIAYVVFPDITWPLVVTVGRNTISPDNVAVMASGNQRLFEPTIIYHNGKRITKDLNRTLDLLLEATDKSYAEIEKAQNQ